MRPPATPWSAWWSALLATVALLLAMPSAQAASVAAEAHPSRAFWLELRGAPAPVSPAGATPSVRPRQFRSVSMDRASLTAAVAGAPRERSRAARANPVVLSLPHPGGGFERFSVTEVEVMEAGLAARHPEIKTYAGRGLDDPSANLRMDLSPLGLHASVRSAQGAWYIDPYYHLDPSLYVSYFGRDLDNVHGPLSEATLAEPQLALGRGIYHAADTVELRGAGFAPNAQVRITVRNQDTDAAPRQVAHAVADAEGLISTRLVADPYRGLGRYGISATDGSSTATVSYQVVADAVTPALVSGALLRTYRLALISDPTYAAYFGTANVTAAKVALMNRVSQVYETETSIRMVLIDDTDKLNLDTTAKATGVNGPCGGSACYTAAQIASCGGSTLTRNRIVAGLLVGASKFDIGHIALGTNGGGIASLGVVGGNNKAQGCTGIPTPVGDFYAVDYVAHEMGHEFSGNHPFNGTVSNCASGNRNAATSVEPGSGSSIMAYAGICGTDNLQPHSDPYWSERSFDEITTYTSAAETNINEVQMGALTGFATDGQQFQVAYGSGTSAPIVRGSTYTVAGIKAAIEAIPGWPSGATVTASAVTDTGFAITFGGTLAGTDAGALSVVGCTGGCTAFVGEIAQGGTTRKNGYTMTPTGNNPPVVTMLPAYAIPLRTPFVLSGSASDPDGDALTYMWEQNDRGAAAGTSLISNTKTNGPLFRQFGTAAIVSATDTLIYGSPGENHTTADPSRVFPDMAQILANNTNADTGACPTASATPTAAQIDCFSEFLPTADYVGFGTNATTPPTLNFRLTARDGKGGVGSANTVLTLAAGTGPFLVTYPNGPVAVDAGSTQTVTWNVAGTSAAPISTTNVKISLSTDSGLSFPTVLAASVPNTGSQAVTLPSIVTGKARIKVEAVGNIYFDVSNADFTIRTLAGDLNGDGTVDCADLAIVKAAFGKRTGQAGFDGRADVNNDGVVDVRDLAFVSQKVAAGSVCR